MRAGTPIRAALATLATCNRVPGRCRRRPGSHSAGAGRRTTGIAPVGKSSISATRSSRRGRLGRTAFRDSTRPASARRASDGTAAGTFSGHAGASPPSDRSGGPRPPSSTPARRPQRHPQRHHCGESSPRRSNAAPPGGRSRPVSHAQRASGSASRGRMSGSAATTSSLLAPAAVRNPPDRPVIVGSQNWSGIDSLATLQLPDDPVVPTFHYYDRSTTRPGAGG